MGKKSGSVSGMNNPDHISESFETIILVRILKFFDADPGWKNLDPGWKKMGSGIPDLQHCLVLKRRLSSRTERNTTLLTF